MASEKDDLDAVRIIVETLQPFGKEEQERIIRWAREKVGLVADLVSPTTPIKGASSESQATAKDIKEFLAQKDPKSDNHFAAAVAYFHRFVAPENQRKESITKEDLLVACRLADRHRLARPEQNLVNAYHAGLLDKAERGAYRINSVGENLVAMTLPDRPGKDKKGVKKNKIKKAARKVKKAKK